MVMKFKVTKEFGFSNFIEVNAGNEFKILNHLRAKGAGNVFKAFGVFDIIEFGTSQKIDQASFPTSIPEISGVTSISFFSLETDTYKSPPLESWLDESVCIGYVTLELDRILYCPDLGSVYGIASNIIQTLQALCEERGVDVAFFGSLGRSELIAISKSNSFEKIWEFTRAARSIKASDIELSREVMDDNDFPIFAKTTTIPAISYRNIKLVNDLIVVENIAGQCEASISIGCPAGFESRVSPYFTQEEGFVCAGQLGVDDIVVQTSRPIDAKSFIEKILSFRVKWATETAAPVTTVTSILDRKKEPEPENILAYQVNVDQLKLSSLETLKYKSPRLANRVLSFVQRYNAATNHRSAHLSTRQLGNFINYFKDLIVNYENNANSSCDEDAIRNALEILELGLAQRLHDGFGLPASPYSVFVPHGEGIFTSIVALEVLVKSIVKKWAQFAVVNEQYAGLETDPDWTGFPVFSDANGFSLLLGESIFVPYEAAYNMSSKYSSWLTLTHEISHAIYSRLNIPNRLSDIYQQLFDNSFPLIKPSATINNYTPVDDQLNEFFTHWYDYYHFYNGDFKLFLRSIWRSWIVLPIVLSQFSEYFLRSFVVSLLVDTDRLVEEFSTRPARTREYLIDKFWEHISDLEHLPDLMPKHLLEQQVRKIEAHIELAFRYIPIVYRFTKFKDDRFRSSINSTYPMLEKHISMLKNGEVVLDDIENPYLLTKTLILESMFLVDDLKDSRQHCEAALILSLKNQIHLYHADDNQSEEGDY